ncbi:MAG: 23S rRNA (adenine(2503)-C(2))-methyltransferase RlmN [Nitrospirae bacterium]|nr:23S rRNA (adenine(2503)-C(2))-methyltransferase RlmN [Nitrospirota bacterium]
MMKTNLKEFSADELVHFIEALGEKPYRAKQVIGWIYRKLTFSIDEMTDLSKEAREKLKKISFISSPALIGINKSKDGTVKFLFELEDGERIESVLIPNIHGEGKYTICVSSQAGCTLKCLFCRTGAHGFRRNLKSYEIVDQAVFLGKYLKESLVSGSEPADITNIVLMGMGEPLNNFAEVNKALWKFTSVMNYSKRRITLSTAGIVPKIYELGKYGPGVNLAVSLNATTDEIRSRIMPINRKFPIKELLQACREYPLAPRRRITFEYVLIGGVNDSNEDALRLVRLLKGIRAKVNLIPCNPSNDKALAKPSGNRVHRFQEILLNGKLSVSIRKSKGSDISAACGQLKAEYENKPQ